MKNTSINGLYISEIEIYHVNKNSCLVANVRVVLNGCLRLDGLQIYSGTYGTFVTYPPAEEIDKVHFIFTHATMTKHLEDAIMREYYISIGEK